MLFRFAPKIKSKNYVLDMQQKS